MAPDPPLPAATFYVLLALLNGEKHGYAILKEASELSETHLQMGPATLYTTIQRLVRNGWIEAVTSAPGDDPRRRYYRLTPSGRKAVRKELDRMESLVRKAKAMRLRPAKTSS